MASKTAARSVHTTIATASTAETITLDPWLDVEVLNSDAAATLYFVTDGTTPTVGGDDTYIVGPNSSLTVPVNSPDAPRAPVKVTLICATAGIAYSVTGSNSTGDS